MIAYNVEAAKVDISSVKGDTIKLFFEVKINGALYPGMGSVQIDLTIRKFDGTEVRKLSSAGTSPAITIDNATSVYCISTAALTESGEFKYDAQITAGADVLTFQYGSWTNSKEQTT